MTDNWQNRTGKMLCMTCVFFVEKRPYQPDEAAASVLFGRCRRHAPTMNGFPAVYGSDWCGDHKLDEAHA